MFKKCNNTQLLKLLFVILLLNFASYVFVTRNYSKHTEYSPVIIRGFLSENEVNFINGKAEGEYKQSVVGTQSYTLDDKVRVSETAWLALQNDEKLQQIVNRAIGNVREDGIKSDVLKLPRNADWKNCEKLQIVRYKEGGFYKPHYDTIEKSKITKDTQVMYRKAGPRISTIVISLSNPTDYGNGETVFPKLNRRYKLNKGDALMFHNIDKRGKLIENSFHGGDPLTYGEKKICNIWIHGLPTP